MPTTVATTVLRPISPFAEEIFSAGRISGMLPRREGENKADCMPNKATTDSSR